jgi:hypothetical protein
VSRRHLQHPRQRRRYLVVGALALVAAGVWCGNAAASWLAASTGVARSRSPVLLAGQTPTASTTGLSTVTVQWTTSTFDTGVRVTRYTMKRYNGVTGQLSATLPTCSATGSAASCVDSGVAPGSWSYSVTPIAGGWHGAESPKSTSVVVI